MFRQCEMKRGSAGTVAWIDERGAKVGASVELKTADGNFWTVTKVFDPKVDEKALREKQERDRGCLPSIVGMS